MSEKKQKKIVKKKSELADSDLTVKNYQILNRFPTSLALLKDGKHSKVMAHTRLYSPPKFVWPNPASLREQCKFSTYFSAASIWPFSGV